MSGNATASTKRSRIHCGPPSSLVGALNNAMPLSGQRRMEASTEIMAMETPPIQPTHSHRRDGSLPSGNRRGRNTRIRPSPGAQVQLPSHDIPAPSGTEPGSVTSA